MEERKFLHPSHTYDRDWVIDCLLKNKGNGMEFIRKGKNVLEALDINAYLTLPYDCLLVYDQPIRGYKPHGMALNNYECEVYFYYIDE